MNARRINTYSMAEIDENQRYEEVVAGNVVRRAAAEPSVQPKRKIQKAPLERVSRESQKKRGIFTAAEEQKHTYLFSSVLTIVGMFIVAVFAFMVLSQSAVINSNQMKIMELENEIKSQINAREAVYSEYLSSVDIGILEAKAQALGMHAPTEGQIVIIE
ncbi:MAG: hypothetical protein E7315_05435 [Clostridiales bacterium]|nr:hypothetical protein [Clostridiales bacterium]